MHFLVFVPDAKPDQLEEIAQKSGLTAVLGGHTAVPNRAGPVLMPNCDPQPGLMLAWTAPHSPFHEYAPERQDWWPSICRDEHGNPRYWVGFWKQAEGNPPFGPPKENELRRSYTQAGNLTEFAGQKWKLPTPDTVDAEAVYNDDGSMRWETVRQYSWVCDEAVRLKEEYLEDDGIRTLLFQVDPSAQVAWLLKLLQINYRILPEVAVALRMWVGREHILTTFLATIDLQLKQPEAVHA